MFSLESRLTGLSFANSPLLSFFNSMLKRSGGNLMYLGFLKIKKEKENTLKQLPIFITILFVAAK